MTRTLQWSNGEWSNPVQETNDNIVRLRPDQVTSTTNVLWLNARGQSAAGVNDVIITGQGCSQWTDRSSSNAHFLQTTDAARPLVGTSGGHACVSTDDNRFMSTAHLLAHKIETSSYFYVFMAYRSLENRTGRSLMGRYQTQLEWGLNVTSAAAGDRPAFVVGSSSVANLTAIAPNDGRLKVIVGSWHPVGTTALPGQIVGIFDDTGNGSLNYGSSVAAPTVGSNTTLLGRAFAASGGAVADIHEVAIFKSATKISRRDFNGIIDGMLWEWK